MSAIYQITSKSPLHDSPRCGVASFQGESTSRAVRWALAEQFEAVEQMITRLNVSMCVNDGNFSPTLDSTSEPSTHDSRSGNTAPPLRSLRMSTLCPFPYFVFFPLLAIALVLTSSEVKTKQRDEKKRHKNYSLMVGTFSPQKQRRGERNNGFELRA